MSDQPFSFPPPPPPPPKRTIDDAYQQNQGYQNGRGTFRGGRTSHGNVRGGRGSYGYHRPGSSTPSNYGSTLDQNFSHKPFDNGPSRGSHGSRPQKRDHGTAFKPLQQFRSRPAAPPPVPNFNASIEHLLVRKPSAEQSSQKPLDARRPESKQEIKKQNLLGLTPAKFEHDSDPEDDENEEQRLATTTASASGAHVFEYNGNPLMLQTREQILDWIAERKRRYPTKARREAAKKEAAEKARKRQEEHQARQEARKEALARRDQERAERLKANDEARKAREQDQKARKSGSGDMDDAVQARLRAEKLRKRAVKAQRDLAKAEEALRLVQAKEKDSLPLSATVERDAAPALAPDLAPEQLHAMMDSTADKVDEETSSSGSSTDDSDSESHTDSNGASDSDSAPEVISTKHVPCDPDPFPQPKRNVRDRSPKLCPHLLRYKKCKYGSKCRYSHDLSRKGRRAAAEDQRKSDTATSAAGNAKRKGLWQLMVEKEQEEERKRLLGAIITLGERGLLDDPSAKPTALS